MRGQRRKGGGKRSPQTATLKVLARDFFWLCLPSDILTASECAIVDALILNLPVESFMPIRRLYAFASLAGTFYICASSKYYYAMLEGKLLDFRSTPERVALAIAVRFNLPSVSSGSAQALNIPTDLRDWQKCE